MNHCRNRAGLLIFIACLAVGYFVATIDFSPDVIFDNPYVDVSDGEWAMVTRVVDGDTIYVQFTEQMGQQTGEIPQFGIRYIGMDTPETKHPRKGLEPYGKEATEANRKLVEGQLVMLVVDVRDTDRYDRLLRYVFLEDGTFVNLKLVEDGYARVSTYPPDVKYEALFLKAEQKAREENRGLWALEDETGNDDS